MQSSRFGWGIFGDLAHSRQRVRQTAGRTQRVRLQVFSEKFYTKCRATRMEASSVYRPRHTVQVNYYTGPSLKSADDLQLELLTHSRSGRVANETSRHLFPFRSETWAYSITPDDFSFLEKKKKKTKSHQLLNDVDKWPELAPMDYFLHLYKSSVRLTGRKYLSCPTFHPDLNRTDSAVSFCSKGLNVHPQLRATCFRLTSGPIWLTSPWNTLYGYPRPHVLIWSVWCSWHHIVEFLACSLSLTASACQKTRCFLYNFFGD